MTSAWEKLRELGFELISLSKKEREENIVLAVRLMMQGLGEPYEWQEHDATTEKFADVYRTTWDDLVESGFVDANWINWLATRWLWTRKCPAA